MGKILLVDDDKDLANLTKMVLAKKGYEVLMFHEAYGAIEAARTQKPNLILMDVMLPGITGAEAVKKIREDVRLQDIPVVFLTALAPSDKEDPDTGVESPDAGIVVGGQKYKTLGKPYEIEELLKLVKETLR